MRKLIGILPIVMLIGAMAATSAFAASDSYPVDVSASVAQASLITIAIKTAPIAGADLTAISFGTVPNTSNNHRIKQATPPLGGWVDYFVGAGTHEIRVWFDNYPTTISDPTKAVGGLKTTIGTTNYFWGLKVWSPNFGPKGYDNTTGGADPENDSYWENNYGWILERAYKVDGFGKVTLAKYPEDDPLTTTVDEGIYKDETRTKLAWYYPVGTAKRPGTALDARLRSRFRVDLAIDALDAQYAGATATDYSGVLTFDLTQTP